MIRVIGLGGTQRNIQERLDGWTVLARSIASARAVIPESVAIDHGYDDEFDHPDVTTIVTHIATDLVQRASDSDRIAYLVPGIGTLADATVAELRSHTGVELFPGTSSITVTGGRVSMVDALDLAVAQSRAPFEAGFAPLDPSQITIVTNWYGQSVTALASHYIRRYYPDFENPVPNEAGEILIDTVPPEESCRTLPALQSIAARLRGPGGCPWDQEQTIASMLPHLIDEMDELRVAIEANDPANQREEMGDVLMNLILCAQIAHEQGPFEMSDVLEGVGEKMVRRHPHVFGDLTVSSVDDVFANWQRIKEQEQAGYDNR